VQGFPVRLRPLTTALALGALVATPAGAADGPLLAPPGTCANDNSVGASPDTMEAAIGCLVNHARRAHGAPALPRGSRLARSAQMKADLIVKCDQFAHSPCGRPWAEVFREAGYRGWAREVLATGTGELGTARAAMEMWLNSPNHREAILAPEWTAFGIGVRAPVTLEGTEDAAVFTAHFGRPPSRPSERQPGDALRSRKWPHR
jgi:uncharacterized protein YkwD